MASLGITLPSATSKLNAAETAAAVQKTAAGGASSMANQSTFLKLLVAQLQNQDPAQPLQGTEFVTQLAQFTNLEQSLALRQDADALSQKFLGTVPSGGTVAISTATGAATPAAGG